MASRQRREKNDARKRILIVDDHPVMREGLTTVINEEADLIVCGQASNASQAITAADSLNPDAAIVDISLEGRSGIELIKDLKARHPKLPIMALSMHDEALYAERALRAGARGYVMKREATKDVIEALRRVLNGSYHVSEQMANRLVRQIASPGNHPADSPVELLSDRELEVFQLIGRGRATREIADTLHLSMKTISCYRQNIKAKLNLASTTEVTHVAIHWAKANQTD